MNIDKTLREDAARLAQVQPPIDLRARLQASLEVLPPHIAPLRAKRQVRKWFMPAAAMLVMAMLIVLIPPLNFDASSEEGLILAQAEPELCETGDAVDEDALTRSLKTKQDLKSQEDSSDLGVVTANESAPDTGFPLGRMGIFAGLALITGLLCVTELKGHPRLLVPALVALALFLTLGLLYFLGII